MVGFPSKPVVPGMAQRASLRSAIDIATAFVPSLPPSQVHKEALQRHHAAQVNQHYEEVVFRGRRLRCGVTRRAGDIMVSEGGTVDQSVLMIRMAKSHFSAAPQEKETLTCLGSTWIIDQVAGKLAWEQEYVLTVGKQ